MNVRLRSSLLVTVLMAAGCGQSTTSQPASDAGANDASDAATLTSGCRIVVDADPDSICTTYSTKDPSALHAFEQACRDSPDSVVVSACPTNPVGCCLTNEATGAVRNSCYYTCVMGYDPSSCVQQNGQWTLVEGSPPCPGTGDAGVDGGGGDARTD